MKKYALILLLLPALVLGHSYSLDMSQVELTTSMGYTIPYLDGAVYINEVGAPNLPWLPIKLVVPAGMGAAEVKVLSYETIDLPGVHVVFPTQEERPISQPAEFEENFDPEIYHGDGVYPEVFLEARGGGVLAGYGIADLVYCPLIYHPASGRLELITRIDFDVEYEPVDIEVRMPRVLTPRAAEQGQSRVQALVLNPEQALVPAAIVEPSRSGVELRRGLNEPRVGDTAEWVLITDASFVEAFEPLVEWKLQKGLTVAVVTTDYIESNYGGVDKPQQIRNFIIDAYTDWSTVYVVLGGDTPYVAERRAWGGRSGDSDDTNLIPSDLYYSALDGDWDNNGNGRWGEYPGDYPLDLYSDVHVSRLSVNSPTQAGDVVNKILTYEREIPADFPLRTIFFAGQLDSRPTWGGDGLDFVALYLPQRYRPVTTYYDRDTTYTAADIIAAYEDGQSAVVSHLQHSNYTVVGAGSHTYLTVSDFLNLGNDAYQGWIYTQGCMAGGFDRTVCVLEALVNNPDGGALTALGNSRYGWYSPGSPATGTSNLFNVRFFDAVFAKGFTSFGAAHSWHKDYYVGSHSSFTYRWVLYTQNVLGPNETRIWTDAPGYMHVEYPEVFNGGDFVVSVYSVSSDLNNTPLADATVCLYLEDGIFLVDTTSSNGQVVFNLTEDVQGDLYVTVDKANYYPYQGVCDFDFVSAELVSFSGRASDDGALISWELLDDGTFAGVNLYRGLERLNDNVLRLSRGDYLDRDALGRNDYYLEVLDSEGAPRRFGPVTIFLPESRLVRELSHAFPNPASHSVSFELALPMAEHVSLEIYDIAGRRVATAVAGQLSAGRHTLSWDCSGVADGVYLARLSADGETLTRRFVITR